MAGDKQQGLGAFAVVAVIAFLLGRESVGDRSEPVQPQQYFADSQSSNFNEPAPSPSEPAEPLQFAAPVDNEPRYFRNCSHARAEGAAPVREGDAGYAPHLDRDGDGVGCE
jgi:Excalibur calcium-binding domain